PECLAFLPDGKAFLVGGLGGVRLVEPGKMPKPLGGSRVTHIAISADGKRAAWNRADAEQLTLWDLENGRALRQLPGVARFRCSAFLPGGRLLSGDENGNLRLWD